jgi:hypothetical protein
MIDAPGMTFLPGVTWPGESLEDSLQRAAEELLWRIQLTEPFGMKLGVEPHTGSVIDTPEKIARLLELTLSLDYGHFVYAGFREQDLEVFIPQTRHIHCRQAAPGVMQARVYEGTIDFERLTAHLDRASALCLTPPRKRGAHPRPPPVIDTPTRPLIQWCRCWYRFQSPGTISRRRKVGCNPIRLCPTERSRGGREP